jgi:dihydroorotate dehydrogenase electron transfer subunit
MQQVCTVAEHTQLSDGMYLMVLDAPQIAAAAKCGQFIHISCGAGNLLRRPISICTWQADMLDIVYQVKGDGTRWLSERVEGDTLDVLGPLGNGFDITALGERPIFIGGGIGVPPMLACAQSACDMGAKPYAVLGFRTKDAVILEDDFKAVCPTVVTTDDGTYGRHGFVTDAMLDLLEHATGVAACGPKPMLKRIAALVDGFGLPCQVSMEERMGCGIGACLVCACTLRDENGNTYYGHVCKNGPVFDSREVVW